MALGLGDWGWLPKLALHLTSPAASPRSVPTALAMPATCQTVVPALASPPVSIVAAFSPEELAATYQEATSRRGRWVDLTTLEWEGASSGWQRLADFHSPRRGQAFPYAPLVANGQAFASGIGTYPLSEIVYRLDGEYGALHGAIAIDDSATDRASARFSVYADDLLLYRSPVMLRSDAPIVIELPLLGASELRLVVDDADDGSTGDYADWLTPMLFRPTAGAAGVPGRALLEQARQAVTVHTAAAGPSRGRPVFDAKAGPVIPLLNAGATNAWFDEAQCSLMLVHPHLRLALGYGGADHGRLTLLPANGELPAVHGASSEILLLDGSRIALVETQPVLDHPWDVAPVQDRDLGSGTQITAHFRAPGDEPVVVEIAVFDQPVSATYRVRPGASRVASGYTYLTDDSWTLIGDRPRYLSERGKVWDGRLPDDGLERSVPLEPSKPFLLWSEATGQGLLMATIDVSEAPMSVTIGRDPGDRGVRLELGMKLLPIEMARTASQASPRLWMQFVDASHTINAFGDYQHLMRRIYPPARLPDWVKLQWNSWWTYGPTPTEEGIKRQVDFIAHTFGDLGPWHVVIDAAWYVAYGHPAADLRNVDPDKFPSGIRPVTEYAHERGINVLLFVPAGFIHSGQEEGGEWLALQAIIDAHPDWLIPLFADPGIEAYMLNYAHPEVRSYMESVVSDVIREHGADGVLLDGLADPEGQFTGIPVRDGSPGRAPYLPVMSVYRLIADQLRALHPDPYFEAGWVNPVFAHPYSHAFWWADDWPAFDNPYPFGGLLQHVDYALFQWAALGQRSKMGTVWGDANSRQVQRWIEAALALGSQPTLSFDLAGMEPDRVSALRSRLAHYNAFEGTTITSSRPRPNAFATTSGHITYLGVINRRSRAQTFADEIGELGVIAPGLMAYDVERDRWLPAVQVPGLTLEPKSFRLFLIAHQPRIVWSNASWAYEPSDDGSLVARVEGPAGLPGFAQVWAPGAATVALDGMALTRGSTPGPGRYAYDARTGVVRVALTFGEPSRLEVRW